MSAALLDDLAVLVDNLTMPGDDAATASRLGLQRFHSGNDLEGVAEDDREQKSPFQDGQECEGVDSRRIADQARGDGQNQQAMGNRSSERTLFRELVIAVERVEVSRQSSEEDHVGFRDGSARTLPFVAYHQIVQGENVEGSVEPRSTSLIGKLSKNSQENERLERHLRAMDARIVTGPFRSVKSND